MKRLMCVICRLMLSIRSKFGNQKQQDIDIYMPDSTSQRFYYHGYWTYSDIMKKK